MNAESFFSRWQQRPAKADEKDLAHEAEVRDSKGHDPDPAPSPLPTEGELAALLPGASVADFMRAGVDEGVKRGALKKLFSDPHYNVMDGLDTYIADYGVPDPIPEAMLHGLNQVKNLFLFEHSANRPGAAPVPSQATVVEGERAAESGAADGMQETFAHDEGAPLTIEETQTRSSDAESLNVEIPSPSLPHGCARDGLALSGEPQCGSKPRFAPVKGEEVDGVACSGSEGV